MKSIFEVECEGDSVLIWEAGTGHRVVYPIPSMAEPIFTWLTGKSNAFHKAKEDTGTAAIYVYGEDHTSYSFIRRFLLLAASAGYGVQLSCTTRPESEYW